MISVVKIVLGLTLFQLTATQDNSYSFAPTGTSRPRPFIGGPFPQVGSGFGSPPSQTGGTDDTFPGVPAPLGQVVLGPNSFPAFTGVSGQGGQGDYLLQSQGPAFLDGQGAAFVSGQVFGQSGPAGVSAQEGGFSLPSQQGPPFLGGSLLGQAGTAGVRAQQGGLQVAAAQGAGFGFGPSIIQQEITPTVTQTFTVDAFETLTDLILHSVPVTQTQFTLQTTTRVTRVVVATPVNNALVLSTSVVFSPTSVTLTKTKSDFRVVLRTSVSYATITHTSYAITHVPFTITATETVRVTSPVVRTIINTSVDSVTNYRTFTNTVYVHGGYY